MGDETDRTETDRTAEPGPQLEPNRPFEPAPAFELGPPAQLIPAVESGLPPEPGRPSSSRSTSPLLGLAMVALVVGAALVSVALFSGGTVGPPPAGSAGPSGDPSALVAGATPHGPTASPATASAAPLHRIGERLVVAGIAAHTVLRVEDWGGVTAAGRRTLAVQIQVEALKNEFHFDFQDYQVLDGVGGAYSPLSRGKEPALTYGSLPRGDRTVGWVTFAVPLDGPYVVSIRTSLGYNGLDDTSRVALDPILPASPDPTPGPTPGPTRTPSPQPTPPSGLANYGYPASFDSTYFSGYGAALPGSSVSEVHGNWTQPKVRCSGSKELGAAFWVGIEDGKGGYLQQLGTLAICPGSGPPVYTTWYEMFPLRAVPVHMTVKPGDRMTASVSVKGSAWHLTLKNRTTGESFAITKQRIAKATVALWIAEAPSTSTTEAGSHVLPLANFGSMTFTNCSATVGGHTGTITDRAWGQFRFDMETTSGAAKASTSATSVGGASFTSTWRHT